MSTSPDATSNDPARPVADMVQSVDALGTNTGRLFGRLYGTLRRRKRERESALQQTVWRANQLERLAASQATSIAQLTGVLAMISEGVIMQDNEGRVVLMNKAAHELLGSMRTFWDSDLGRMFLDSRHLAPAEGEITLGEPQRVEVNNRVIGAQIAVVRDETSGERLGTVLMLRDVTRDAISDRLKDQFITHMSHELRTPLTAIKGMAEVLLAMPEDRPPNRKFLEAISRNAAVLDRMIVELLDISEIGAGSFAVREQEVNLPALVLKVILGLRSRIEKADLQLSFAVANARRLTLLGDDRRLQWAVGHLIDNSIKYTEPGGEILVQVGRIREGYVLLEVSDTGVGISPRDLPHIFERFYRGEARTPDGRLIDPRGLGQGLFVARAVAEAHGGYLTVATALGEGSTFTMALPLDRPATPPVPLPEMPAAVPLVPVEQEPPTSPADTTQPNRRAQDVRGKGGADRAHPLRPRADET
ncbi:MAG: sensor histidine kinase [Aggregatilineaceae bacterium]